MITISSAKRAVLNEEAKPIISKELKKEILILHKLGLEDYEINYLLTLKLKELSDNNEMKIKT